METLVLKRVSYGLSGTPLQDREYSQGAGYPVGTKSEIKSAYKHEGYKNIRLESRDGVLEQLITYYEEA